MAAPGSGDAAVEKMMDFIQKGAEGNELSEGLMNRLTAVAQTLSVDNIPSAVNKNLTGKTFRRMANKMDQVNADDIEILADWLEDEYPDALAGFKKDPITVGFTPSGGKVLGTIAEPSAAPTTSADLAQELRDEMHKCASKQMLPDPGACAALSFALHAGRLPDMTTGNGPAYGSEVRLCNEYKVLCKVEIDNLKKAMDKCTNLALNAYFDGLMQQMEDNNQPSMQSRIAIWYQNARTTFPDVDDRIEYIKAYLNKWQGKGLPESIDHQLVMRFKVMRGEQLKEQERSVNKASSSEGSKSSADDEEKKLLKKELESARQSASDLRSQCERLKSRSEDDRPVCDYCGKKGHIAKNCRERKADLKAKAEAAKKEDADADE